MISLHEQLNINMLIQRDKLLIVQIFYVLKHSYSVSWLFVSVMRLVYRQILFSTVQTPRALQFYPRWNTSVWYTMKVLTC